MSTGGGCEAYSLTAQDGSVVLITDGDSQLPFTVDEPEFSGLTFSYIKPDGEDLGWYNLHHWEVDAGHVIAAISRWQDGDPMFAPDGRLADWGQRSQATTETAAARAEVPPITDVDGYRASVERRGPDQVRLTVWHPDDPTVAIDLDADMVLQLITRLASA